MLNIVIGFIWKYIVMGLVVTLVYAVSLALYFGKKTNWDQDLMDECLDILAQTPGYGRFCNTEEFRKFFVKAFPLAIAIWPINIATGLSRVPDALEHIKESTKEKS